MEFNSAFEELMKLGLWPPKILVGGLVQTLEICNRTG
jgi:hypothetical protein